MLLNVHTNQWDDELLSLLRIPKALMPEVLPSSAHFGDIAADLLGHAIRIGGVAGDQQSALFGQACFTAGMAKNTYGTGCFMLMHTGHTFQTSQNGLLTTSAAQATMHPEFAMEGSVFVGGAVVQWLRDGLRAISSSSEVRPWLCRARFRRRDDGARPSPAWAHRTGTRRARHHHRPDAAPRWPTLPAQRSKASPTKAPPCCWP